jgi:hypothetical protein
VNLAERRGLIMLQVNDNEIPQTFLHPPGPSKSFKYPSLSDILWVPASKVLTKMDIETAIGHTHLINAKDTCCTTKKTRNLTLPTANSYSYKEKVICIF